MHKLTIYEILYLHKQVYNVFIIFHLKRVCLFVSLSIINLFFSKLLHGAMTNCLVHIICSII